jgi:hypothetical protein
LLVCCNGVAAVLQGIKAALKGKKGPFIAINFCDPHAFFPGAVPKLAFPKLLVD